MPKFAVTYKADGRQRGMRITAADADAAAEQVLSKGYEVVQVAREDAEPAPAAPARRVADCTPAELQRVVAKGVFYGGLTLWFTVGLLTLLVAAIFTAAQQ